MPVWMSVAARMQTWRSQGKSSDALVRPVLLTERSCKLFWCVTFSSECARFLHLARPWRTRWWLSVHPIFSLKENIQNAIESLQVPKRSSLLGITYNQSKQTFDSSFDCWYTTCLDENTNSSLKVTGLNSSHELPQEQKSLLELITYTSRPVDTMVKWFK